MFIRQFKNLNFIGLDPLSLTSNIHTFYLFMQPRAYFGDSSNPATPNDDDDIHVINQSKGDCKRGDIFLSKYIGMNICC